MLGTGHLASACSTETHRVRADSTVQRAALVKYSHFRPSGKVSCLLIAIVQLTADQHLAFRLRCDGVM